MVEFSKRHSTIWMALESIEKKGEIPMAYIGQAKIPRALMEQGKIPRAHVEQGKIPGVFLEQGKIPRAKRPKAQLKQRVREAHEARRAPSTSVAVKKAATERNPPISPHHLAQLRKGTTVFVRKYTTAKGTVVESHTRGHPGGRTDTVNRSVLPHNSPERPLAKERKNSEYKKREKHVAGTKPSDTRAPLPRRALETVPKQKLPFKERSKSSDARAPLPQRASGVVPKYELPVEEQPKRPEHSVYGRR